MGREAREENHVACVRERTGGGSGCLRCRSFSPNQRQRRAPFDDARREGRKSPMNAPDPQSCTCTVGALLCWRCVATLVHLAASLWVPRVSPACLRPPPLSLSPSVSVPRVCVSRLPLQRLLFLSPFFLSFPCPTRVESPLEKLAARPLEPQRSHEQCSSTLGCRAARFKFR